MQSNSSNSHASLADEPDPWTTKDLNLASYLAYRDCWPQHIEAPSPADPTRYATFVFPRTAPLAEALVDYTSHRTTFVDLRLYNDRKRELFTRAREVSSRGGER